jgi:hypothetical protein
VKRLTSEGIIRDSIAGKITNSTGRMIGEELP